MVSIAIFLLVQNFNSLIFSHGHPAWELIMCLGRLELPRKGYDMM